MEQAVLTDDQKIVLDLILRDPAFDAYYLSGGTALSAFYLEHRYSDDLDFFTPEAIDSIAIETAVARIKDHLNVKQVRYEKIHDRRLFFFDAGTELKVEFALYPFKRLDPMNMVDGLRIDSLRDLAANKLMALLNRFDPKDFVDLYALLKDRSLAEIRMDAETKFGLKISALTLGSELAKVRRVEALPRMIQPLVPEELKNFFTQESKKLGEEIVSS